MQILLFVSLCGVSIYQLSAGQTIQAREKEDFCASIGNPNQDSMAHLKEFVRDIFLNGFFQLREEVERETGYLRQTLATEIIEIKRNQVSIEERQRNLSETLSEVHRSLSDIFVKFDDNDRQIVQLRSTQNQTEINEENIRKLNEYVESVAGNQSIHFHNQEGIAELSAKLFDVSRIMNDSDTRIIRNAEEQMVNDSESMKKLTDYVQSVSANQSVDLMQLKSRLLNDEDEKLNTSAALLTLQTEVAKLKERVRSVRDKVVQTEISICPSGWTLFTSSCYVFIQAARSWDDASIRCLQYGAKLVEVETKEENDFLRQILLKDSVDTKGW
ncbi:low affinity immunoglobulin epsilon Fc receptor-like isoform X3 [Ostrea edulis]|uniref:low affinity immunoglobulin epsilon Fc receptor-like isoform X3 n=1 Tax=Ostrea edulis TaxID=37623 RepID=UPI002094B305|nr:low affinity immunoglobulin epsilon Fc receptor-like isoform X3 [Ostrea edulis]